MTAAKIRIRKRIKIQGANQRRVKGFREGIGGETGGGKRE
jgi:hypothetical protein